MNNFSAMLKYRRSLAATRAGEKRGILLGWLWLWGLTDRHMVGKLLHVKKSATLRTAVDEASHLPGAGRSSLHVVCKTDGQPYSESGCQSVWQKHIRACHERGVITERFTFHDIRVKAGSDAKGGRLLGHLNPATLRRIYLRKPERVGPTI